MHAIEPVREDARARALDTEAAPTAEGRVVNRTRWPVQRRTAIEDYGISLGASPVQLRAFDDAVAHAHEGIVAFHARTWGGADVVQRKEAGGGAPKVGAVARKHASHIQSMQDAKLKQAIEGIAAGGHDMARQVGAALEPATARALAAWVAKTLNDEQLMSTAGEIVAASVEAHRGGDEAGKADAGAKGVQRRSSGEDAGAVDVHAAAAHGIAGGGGQLPYYDRIQRSFGAHDVSGVRSHVGGRAREGAEAMGAEAYATGSHVAFRAAPDLHTAAHEAAHIVQQRAGVSLKGGVGAVGDAYERHADAVADLVVQGRSAEALLGTPGGAHTSEGPVQRKVGPQMAQDAKSYYGAPEYYALQLIKQFKATYGKEPSSVDQLRALMKLYPPPLAAAVHQGPALEGGIEAQGNAADTHDGDGFCRSLADYGIRALEYAAERMNEDAKGRIGEIVAVTRGKEDDTEKHGAIVFFPKGKTSERDAIIIDLWMGKGQGSIGATIDMKEWRFRKGEKARPDAHGTVADWKAKCKALWSKKKAPLVFEYNGLSFTPTK